MKKPEHNIQIGKRNYSRVFTFEFIISNLSFRRLLICTQSIYKLRVPIKKVIRNMQQVKGYIILFFAHRA